MAKLIAVSTKAYSTSGPADGGYAAPESGYAEPEAPESGPALAPEDVVEGEYKEA